MHAVVLSAILSVWILEDSSVDGALILSESGSNKVSSTDYRLKCQIPTFNDAAAWSRDGSPMSTCYNNGCLTPSIPPYYTFHSDATAIYVSFSTLVASENNIKWTCEHGLDVLVEYNVTMDLSTSPDNPESNKPTTIIAAVLGSFLGLIACIGLMIFLYKCIGHQSESPQEPRGPLKINNVEDHIIFEWESPKSDGGSKITEYIVELQGNNFDTWELVGSSYKKITLKVPMYQFKDKGVMSFRVRAKNAVGFSKPLLAQEPFNLQNSYALLADRPVQGRGPAGQVSLLDGVPTDRKLPERE